MPGGATTIGPGRYEHLICLDELDSVPVVTFTSPGGLAGATTARPSAAYVAVMIEGLREAHGLGDDELAAYLTGAPDCAGDVVAAALVLADRRSATGPPAPDRARAPDGV